MWKSKAVRPNCCSTVQSRRSLFAAKAALGLAEDLFDRHAGSCGCPADGHLQHYTQPYPAAGQAAYLWGCTSAVDCMIFFSELLLTVLLANPLPALCVGILGTLLGLFSAFMPAWVGYFVPWGYFIPLNTYRIADWDQASKVVTYMIVPFQWPLLVATAVLAGILFFAAWMPCGTRRCDPCCCVVSVQKTANWHASPIRFMFFYSAHHFRRVRNLQLTRNPLTFCGTAGKVCGPSTHYLLAVFSSPAWWRYTRRTCGGWST